LCSSFFLHSVVGRHHHKVFLQLNYSVKVHLCSPVWIFKLIMDRIDRSDLGDCPLCGHDAPLQNNCDLEDEEMMTAYASSGGPGHAVSCFHLAHLKCLKEYLEFHSKENLNEWARLEALRTGRGETEDEYEKWVEEVNAGKVPIDWNEVTWETEYAWCWLRCQKFRRIHLDDGREFRGISVSDQRQLDLVAEREAAAAAKVAEEALLATMKTPGKFCFCHLCVCVCSFVCVIKYFICVIFYYSH
jgi:hypothetical protein